MAIIAESCLIRGIALIISSLAWIWNWQDWANAGQMSLLAWTSILLHSSRKINGLLSRENGGVNKNNCSPEEQVGKTKTGPQGQEAKSTLGTVGWFNIKNSQFAIGDITRNTFLEALLY